LNDLVLGGESESKEDTPFFGTSKNSPRLFLGERETKKERSSLNGGKKVVLLIGTRNENVQTFYPGDKGGTKMLYTEIHINGETVILVSGGKAKPGGGIAFFGLGAKKTGFSHTKKATIPSNAANLNEKKVVLVQIKNQKSIVRERE